MSALPKPSPMTLEEFLAWEGAQETRHEFVDGEVFAMAGGTLFHTLIAGNLFSSLDRQLYARGCLTLQEGGQLRIDADLFYPDVVVTCDPTQLDRNQIDRPMLLAEVLSPGTEAYDRGQKWARYQHIAGLQTFLLVAQDRITVEVFRRGPSGWLYTMHTDPADTITLAEPPCRLALADIYRGLLDRLPRA